MFNFPDPKTKEPKERRIQRILEVIPGILTWATLIGMFVFSFLLPVYVSIFIIVFDIYWIYRTIFIAYYSVAGYRKLKEGKEIDWWERCQNIMHPENYMEIINGRVLNMQKSLEDSNEFSRKEKNIFKKEIEKCQDYLEEVKEISKIKDQILDWREILHI